MAKLFRFASLWLNESCTRCSWLFILHSNRNFIISNWPETSETVREFPPTFISTSLCFQHVSPHTNVNQQPEDIKSLRVTLWNRSRPSFWLHERCQFLALLRSLPTAPNSPWRPPCVFLMQRGPTDMMKCLSTARVKGRIKASERFAFCYHRTVAANENVCQGQSKHTHEQTHTPECDDTIPF